MCSGPRTRKTPQARLDALTRRRAWLTENGFCINAEKHGKATHGVLCVKCRAKHNRSQRRHRGLEPLELDAIEANKLERLIATTARKIVIRPVTTLLRRPNKAKPWDDRGIDFDAALDTMPIRVLRRLHFFDWVSQSDFRDAMEAWSIEDSNALSAAVTRCVRSGWVERITRPTGALMRADNAYWYRITNAGRAELRERLQWINRLPQATHAQIREHDAELAQYEDRVDPQTLQPLRRAA